MRGKLVIVDGLDGAGKSQAMKGLIQWARDQQKSVFDLRKYQNETGKIGSFEGFKQADVIISTEPTLSGIGKVIKNVLIRESGYSGVSIAQAFAIDREIHYKRIIIPALEAGKLIFQERGLTTSFVYQPLQIHIPLRELMGLPGNKLSLKYPPALIIVCLADPEYLIARSSGGQQIFENLTFQRNLFHRYKSEWLRGLFSSSIFKYIITNPPMSSEDTMLAARRIWEQLIS